MGLARGHFHGLPPVNSMYRLVLSTAVGVTRPLGRVGERQRQRQTGRERDRVREREIARPGPVQTHVCSIQIKCISRLRSCAVTQDQARKRMERVAEGE